MVPSPQFFKDLYTDVLKYNGEICRPILEKDHTMYKVYVMGRVRWMRLPMPNTLYQRTRNRIKRLLRWAK